MAKNKKKEKDTKPVEKNSDEEFLQVEELTSEENLSKSELESKISSETIKGLEEKVLRAHAEVENIRRTAEVANLFTKAGFIVLVSLISPYRSERKKARDIRPEIFREIFIEASIEVCSKRDVKGLYAKAIKGEIKNFTGISSPYEPPEMPNLVINTSKYSIEESVNKLEKYILKEFSF